MRSNVGPVEAITGTNPEVATRVSPPQHWVGAPPTSPSTVTIPHSIPYAIDALTHLYVPAAQSLSSGDFNTSTSSSRTENVAVQSTDVTSPSL